MLSGRIRLSWNRFFEQFQKDLKLWGFFVLFLQLYRLLFIVWFRQYVGETGTWTGVVTVLLQGMRFDSTVASYSIVVPLLASLAPRQPQTFRPCSSLR